MIEDKKENSLKIQNASRLDTEVTQIGMLTKTRWR